MNIFKDFQYQDYHGKKVPEELPKSEYQAIFIAIKSDYKWGSGWTLEEKTRFESIVYPKLKEAGFDIKEGAMSVTCDHLVSLERKEDTNGKIWGGNKLDLYMHPMEFTGYAKPEDTAKIMDVLKNCPECIYDVKLQKAETVYDLSDNEYERILLDNSQKIIETMATAKAKRIPLLFDIGFDFARQCRIPRFGDSVSGGYSGLDIDVRTVNSLYRVADKTGLLEKQNEKPDIQNEEQDYER